MDTTAEMEANLERARERVRASVGHGLLRLLCERISEHDRPFYKVGDQVRPVRGPLDGRSCVVVEACPRDACWYEVQPVGVTRERAVYDWRDLLVGENPSSPAATTLSDIPRDRAAEESALQQYRRKERELMRAAEGLERLLPRDIFNAIVFGGEPGEKLVQRVALGAETLNSVAELFGLRNGMITTLHFPPSIARFVRKLDDALFAIEARVFPNLQTGEAWFARESRRAAPAKGLACHE